jgi:hypothetical protein
MALAVSILRDALEMLWYIFPGVAKKDRMINFSLISLSSIAYFLFEIVSALVTYPYGEGFVRTGK